MRPPIYDTQDVLEFAEMQERTNDAAEELEEDYEFDESKRIDAEAVFNDYYMACRDLCEESDNEPTLNEQGN